MIARWCDTIILYGSKEVLGYAGVLNVDCENNQGSPEQSPRRWNYAGTIFWFTAGFGCKPPEIYPASTEPYWARINNRVVIYTARGIHGQ